MICVYRKGYRVFLFCKYVKIKIIWYRYDMYSVFFIFCYVIEYFIFSMFNVENLRDMLNLVE